MTYNKYTAQKYIYDHSYHGSVKSFFGFFSGNVFYYTLWTLKKNKKCIAVELMKYWFKISCMDIQWQKNNRNMFLQVFN